MMALSLAVAITLEDNNVERLSRQMALSHLSQLVTTRRWNAEHNGVYVFVTDQSQPNPYLAKDPARDLTTTGGRLLTKINPAYMTRQLSELAAKTEAFRLHMTSLDPISPANAPTDWEREALKAFEMGAQEVHTFAEDDGVRSYRYMTPLKFLPDCIKCHELTSDNTGKIRGGITLTLLNPPNIDHSWTITGHLIIAVAGVGAITALGRKLIAIYAKTERDALIDPLTGVYNRRQLIDRLTQDLRASHRTGAPLGFIMLDIDNFKKYNDTFGHLEGDKALKAVASAMGLALRRPQDLAARFGGEEFVGVLPQTTMSGLMKVAERIRADVEGLAIPHPENEKHGVLTVSLGAALYDGKPEDPYSHETLTRLINQADVALYRAKELGRNRIEIAEGIKAGSG